ncbi:MAG: phosphatidylserine/phosphatidylglycerophosphate/cardiolipin synthase family protein [Candidatus Pacebacteria bacterium]|nr:phosphatidylserine/phosphatidylglycerophosphate/cardiolipin synthase family protein [Candidatus Paceibacterota bacterium]MCF7862760.1 phosphatidylserine/phosphatidylglycerophosphate/cardiolipin synthase family protein [Candidatus Paceibacterota bacterium]
MRYKLYTKTEKAWDAMFHTIKRARHSIFLEMYIFSDDTNYDFINLLKQKSQEGVRVKMILNSFKSISFLTPATLEKLQSAGVEILFFKDLLRYTHRKILIVDKKIAFVGGINIYNFFKKWDDLQIKLDGRIVTRILSSFAKVYRLSSGKDVDVLKYEKEHYKDNKGKFGFIEHIPPKDSFTLSKYYKDKIEFAKKSILITTPYFMPRGWIRRSLIRASKRGVKIDFIIPQDATSPKLANLPNYLYMRKLHKYGINFFLVGDMVHSKMMLVDGVEGILGSQNIDILSFDFNMESGIFFSDKKIMKELTDIAEVWKSNSVMYETSMGNHILFDYFLDICFSLFEYIIRAFNRFTRAF